jgi:ribonuclease BN (tRNA processing enzyme)
VKLTVLGGSAAGCNTGAGCSGYLVESGDSCLVVDLGPGTFQELRKHTDFRRLDGIVITHFHVDHIMDLPALRFALAYNPVPPPARIPLWVPPGGTQVLLRLARALTEEDLAADFFPLVFEVMEYEPQARLRIRSVDVSFAPTVHYVPCWAMRISASGASGDLVYTADSGPAAELATFASDCAVLVAESTLLVPSDEPYETRGHLTAEEAGALARDARAATLVLTHMWEELDPAASQAVAARTFDGRIELASPGLSLTW